jgi:DNA-binding NarL/FixJ family response regulator
MVSSPYHRTFVLGVLGRKYQGRKVFSATMRHFDLSHFVKKSGQHPAQQPELQPRWEPPSRQPTPRELEIEDLLCRGYSQENIAAIFGRSVKTVSVQARSLYRKRGVHTQVGLLLAYLERRNIFVFDEHRRATAAP